MNKYDWLEFSTRILGVWFVASGALQVVTTISMRTAMPSEFVKMAGAMGTSGVSGASFFIALCTSFLGTIMVLLAPGFVAWLQRKDARARAPHPRAHTEAGTEARVEPL
jgi:hypothetical protein